jgi:hypothetical protein
MKNCYCKHKNKLITDNEFKRCLYCGWADGQTLCGTSLLLMSDYGLLPGKNYSDFPTMKKLVRNYKREEKLKRILK